MIFYTALSSDTVPMESGTAILDKLTDHKIKTDLLPVLRRREAFDLDSAKAEVRRFMQSLMRLDESEKEFLSCWEGRAYRPDLLFDDPEIVKRIKAHPMALWKADMTF